MEIFTKTESGQLSPELFYCIIGNGKAMKNMESKVKRDWFFMQLILKARAVYV